MKLAYSPASPYVRKVMACAIARGIDNQIERWTVGTTDPALLPVNPLSKVPTLVTDDGVALYDSPVICEYLDSIGDAPEAVPAAPARRAGRRCASRRWATASWTPPSRAAARSRCRRTRAARTTSPCSRARWRARWTCWRAEAGTLGALTTIGEITIGCALGYLDFRYPNEPWRPGHPKLEAWYAKVVTLPPLARTMPPAG